MKICILMPVYNAEKFIDRCIESILNQSYKDFELVLVNDGSSDNSGEICDRYSEKYDNIKVIHKENGGAASARNYCIDYALNESDCEWLCFIDSDDWVHPDYLKILLEANETNGTNISSCDFVRTNGESVETKLSGVSKKISVEKYFVDNKNVAIIPCVKLIRKHLFKGIKFPSSKLYEDEFTLYKVLFKEKQIAVVPDKIYYYYTNENSVTHTKWTVRHLSVIEAYEQVIAFFKNNGYDDLYIWERERFLSVIAMQYQLMSTTAPLELKAEYEPILRKRLKDEIKSYKKQCGKYKLKGNEWVYECAYPKLLKVYWKAKNIFNK